MKTKALEHGRQIQVRGMAYAPTTESGVVFLFGRLAPQLGFCVEIVRPQFPDCIATRNGKRYRIEFELWASNYNHPSRGADMIVCWENDWQDRPKEYRRLEILSLKNYVGAEPRVFVTGCRECNFDELDCARTEWNVPSSAQIGDLILMYRSHPESAVYDLWKVISPHRRFKKHNKQGRWPGLQAGLRRLVLLKHPLTYEALKRDPRTRELTIVRMRFRGKSDITEDWPILHKKIVSLNPTAKAVLRPFIAE